MGNVVIYGCPITEYISPHACKMTDRNSAAAVRENPVSPPLLYITYIHTSYYYTATI